MQDKQNLWLAAAALAGFLGVALGAFGAHGLESRLDAKMMETYRTGVLYHLVHAVVLLALSIAGNAKYQGAMIFIASGIVLFSFSLYIYSVTGIRFLAMITPLGGVSFLTGWALIIYRAFKG